MLGKWVTIVTGLCAGALALGCSASREVEVTGSVSGASAQGDVVLEFFDIDGEEKTSVHTAKAGSDGTFAEKVDLAGEKVLVRAIGNSDGNGACSAGELWGEVTATIEEDAVKVALTLSAAPCPKEE